MPRKYGWLDRDVAEAEFHRPPPKPKPKILEHPLYKKLATLGPTNALFTLELAFGIAEAEPLDWHEGQFPYLFLVNSKNKYGLHKQKCFDWLEGRNGVVDSKIRAMVIEVLQFLGKTTAETNKLLCDLHVTLIKEALRRGPEEFELDARFPSCFWKMGPIRLKEMEVPPPWQELNKRLKDVYQTNSKRWRSALRLEGEQP